MCPEACRNMISDFQTSIYSLKRVADGFLSCIKTISGEQGFQLKHSVHEVGLLRYD